MKYKNILLSLVLMVSLYTKAEKLNLIEDPNLIYLKDRKWDLKQMYVNELPVDSLEIVKIGMSFVFNSQDKAYQINYNAITNSPMAMVMDYTVNANNNTIRLVNTADLSLVYNFKILYIGKNHLVLTFSSPDPKNASVIRSIEYRFVADNSIYSSD